jgi:hypothetical protein
MPHVHLCTTFRSSIPVSIADQCPLTLILLSAHRGNDTHPSLNTSVKTFLIILFDGTDRQNAASPSPSPFSASVMLTACFLRSILSSRICVLFCPDEMCRVLFACSLRHIRLHRRLPVNEAAYFLFFRPLASRSPPRHQCLLAGCHAFGYLCPGSPHSFPTPIFSACHPGSHSYLASLSPLLSTPGIAGLSLSKQSPYDPSGDAHRPRMGKYTPPRVPSGQNHLASAETTWISDLCRPWIRISDECLAPFFASSTSYLSRSSPLNLITTLHHKRPEASAFVRGVTDAKSKTPQSFPPSGGEHYRVSKALLSSLHASILSEKCLPQRVFSHVNQV